MRGVHNLFEGLEGVVADERLARVADIVQRPVPVAQLPLSACWRASYGEHGREREGTGYEPFALHAPI